jgi:hypothetical protein
MELLVDPSTRRGSGKASHRLTRGAELVWQRELPFTLCDVLVLDDGSVGGYAYSEGVRGLGELVVAALNPDGSERWEQRTERPRELVVKLTSPIAGLGCERFPPRGAVAEE